MHTNTGHKQLIKLCSEITICVQKTMIKYKSCTRNINLITRFFKHIKTTHGGKRSYKQKNLKMHKINLDYLEI